MSTTGYVNELHRRLDVEVGRLREAGKADEANALAAYMAFVIETPRSPLDLVGALGMISDAVDLLRANPPLDFWSETFVKAADHNESLNLTREGDQVRQTFRTGDVVTVDEVSYVRPQAATWVLERIEEIVSNGWEIRHFNWLNSLRPDQGGDGSRPTAGTPQDQPLSLELIRESRGRSFA